MSIALLLAVAILVVSFLARRVEGSWVAPAPLFALAWGAYLLLAALAFDGFAPLATGGLYVFLAAVAMCAGSLLAMRGASDTAALPAGELRGALPGLATLVIVALLAGIVDLQIVFHRFGYALTDITSKQALVAVAVGARSQAYAGASEMGVVEWVCFLLLYLGGIGGGLLYRLAERRSEKALALAGLLAGPIVLGLYGSRMGALFGGAFWVGAYLAAAATVAPSLRALDRRALTGGAITAGVGVVGMSILVMVVRYATNFEAVGWRNVLADPFGFGGAFGIWMDQRGVVGTGLTAGARSLTKLVGPLGIGEAPLPAIPVSFTSSNIYTVLRDLIEDFGTAGSLVVLALLGYASRRAFEAARGGNLHGLPVLFGVYTFILTSFAVGIFFYSATMIAFAAAVGYFVWAAWRRARATMAAQAEQPA